MVRGKAVKHTGLHIAYLTQQIIRLVPEIENGFGCFFRQKQIVYGIIPHISHTALAQMLAVAQNIVVFVHTGIGSIPVLVTTLIPDRPHGGFVGFGTVN